MTSNNGLNDNIVQYLHTLRCTGDSKNRDLLRKTISNMCCKILENALFKNKEMGEMGKICNTGLFISLDSVYRKVPGGTFGSVSTIHIDFTQTPSETLKTFIDTWTQRFKEAILNSSLFTNIISDMNPVILEILYQTTTLTTIVSAFWMYNVWIAISDKIIGNHLAVMDKSTYETNELYHYTALRREGTSFTSATLPYNQKHKWYWKPMRLGEAYIFSSTDTPHTAFDTNFENDFGEKNRESVEVRVLYLNVDNCMDKIRMIIGILKNILVTIPNEYHDSSSTSKYNRAQIIQFAKTADEMFATKLSEEGKHDVDRTYAPLFTRARSVTGDLLDAMSRPELVRDASFEVMEVLKDTVYQDSLINSLNSPISGGDLSYRRENYQYKYMKSKNHYQSIKKH